MEYSKREPNGVTEGEDISSVKEGEGIQHDHSLVLSSQPQLLAHQHIGGAFRMNHVEALEIDKILKLSGEGLKRYLGRLEYIRELYWIINQISDKLFFALERLVTSLECNTKHINIYHFQILGKYDIAIEDINNFQLMNEIGRVLERIAEKKLPESVFYELPYFLEEREVAEKLQKIIFLLRYWQKGVVEHGFIYSCRPDDYGEYDFTKELDNIVLLAKEYLQYYMSSLSGDDLAILQFESPEYEGQEHFNKARGVIFGEKIADEIGFTRGIIDNFAFYRSRPFFDSLEMNNESDLAELDERIPLIEDLLMLPIEIGKRIELNPFNPLLYRFIIKYRDCFFSYNDGEFLMHTENLVFIKLKAILGINIKDMKKLLKMSISETERFMIKSKNQKKSPIKPTGPKQGEQKIFVYSPRKKLDIQVKNHTIVFPIDGTYDLVFHPPLPDGTYSRQKSITDEKTLDLLMLGCERWKKYTLRCRLVSQDDYEVTTVKIEPKEWRLLLKGPELSYKFRLSFLEKAKVLPGEILKQGLIEGVRLFLSLDGKNWESYSQDDEIDFSYFVGDVLSIAYSPLGDVPLQEAKIIREKFSKSPNEIRHHTFQDVLKVIDDKSEVPNITPEISEHIADNASLEEKILQLFELWEKDVSIMGIPDSLRFDGKKIIYSLTLDTGEYKIILDTEINQISTYPSDIMQGFLDFVSPEVVLSHIKRWKDNMEKETYDKLNAHIMRVTTKMRGYLLSGIDDDYLEDPKTYTESLRRYFLDDDRFYGFVLKKGEKEEHIFLKTLIQTLQNEYGMSLKISPVTYPFGTKHVEISLSLIGTKGIGGKIRTDSRRPYHSEIEYYFTSSDAQERGLEKSLKDLLQTVLILIGQLGKKTIHHNNKTKRDDAKLQLGYKLHTLSEQDVIHILEGKENVTRYTRHKSLNGTDLLTQAEERFKKGKGKVRTGYMFDVMGDGQEHMVHHIHAKQSDLSLQGIDSIVLRDENFKVSYTPQKKQNDDRIFDFILKHNRHKKYFLRRLRSHILKNDGEQNGFENGAGVAVDSFIKTLSSQVLCEFLSLMNHGTEEALKCKIDENMFLIDAFLMYLRNHSIEITYRSPILLPIQGFNSLIYNEKKENS